MIDVSLCTMSPALGTAAAATLNPPASPPDPVAVSRSWQRSPRCVPRVRRHLRRELEAWGLAELADVAELVLCELFTNAVRHARGPRDRRIATRYQRVPGGVRVEVHDACATWPALKQAEDNEESGRGLALVDALTGARWGVSERDGIGKLVWAVVAAETTPESKEEKEQ